MFVSAPSLSTNGSISLNQTVSVRQGGGGYSSLNLAKLNCLVDNQTYSSAPFGSHSRAGMVNGVISYRKYRNTSYSATMRSYKSLGKVAAVHTQGTAYYATNKMVAFGYIGFYDTGFTEYLSYLNFSGSSLAWQAVYNRGVMTNMLNRAIAEAKQKAKAQKLDLSESLAGIQPTVRMIAENTSKILLSWRAARKGNFGLALKHLGLTRDVKRLPKDAANFWLEIQYGWRPLAQDIYDGVQLVNSALNPSSNPEQLRVVRRIQQDLLVPLATTSGSTFRVVANDAAGVGSVEVKYRFRVDDPYWAYLSSLSFTNPLYFAWVAIPFSFVVDWLIPIGDWLDALGATVGLTFTSGYSTRRSWGGCGVVVDSYSTGVYPKVYLNGTATAYADYAQISRTPYVTWPSGKVYFRFPFSSDTRVVNAIALTKTTRKWV